MSDRQESDYTRATGVLIVADVRLYREGIAAGLHNREEILILGASASRADARAKAHHLRPDVVVLDMATRESLELIRDLQEDGLDARVLAFAVEEAAPAILRCAEAGAAGYVTEEASLDELAAAIIRIARGELLCSPRIAAKLFGSLSQRAVSPSGKHEARGLTNREREVYECIQRGDSNKEIARRLNIAEPTVKNHVHQVLAKLAVTSRAQAAARTRAPVGRSRLFAPAGPSGRETR